MNAQTLNARMHEIANRRFARPEPKKGPGKFRSYLCQGAPHRSTEGAVQSFDQVTQPATPIWTGFDYRFICPECAADRTEWEAVDQAIQMWRQADPRQRASNR